MTALTEYVCVGANAVVTRLAIAWVERCLHSLARMIALKPPAAAGEGEQLQKWRTDAKRWRRDGERGGGTSNHSLPCTDLDKESSRIPRR